MRFAACLTLALSILAGPTVAQTVLPMGTTSGSLTDGDARAGDVRHDCYLLQTTPGSLWTVTMMAGFDAYIQIGRGVTCQNAEWDIRKDDIGGLFSNTDAQAQFAAGGGNYLVMARGYNSNALGAYTLRVEMRPGTATRNLLPPGDTPVEMEVGSASTSGTGAAGPKGQVIQDGPDYPSMIVVPAGSFMMGSPASETGRQGSEGPRHLVTLHNAFAIGRYEVTFAEYDVCIADGVCRQVADNGWGRGRRPVVNVSFGDAQRYVVWLSGKTGEKYFLPTESEWEYAARAGTDTPWNTGSAVIGDDANILNQFAKTVVVGGYPANAFGLHDTIGNVSEWTQDCMDTGYVGAPNDGSAAASGDCNAQAVLRGGNFASEPMWTRSAARIPVGRRQNANGIGFRVARAL